MKPKTRVKAALWLLILSIVGMLINVAMYMYGIMDEKGLILVTLILSWLAITLTATDILSTQDVRKEQDDKNE